MFGRTGACFAVQRMILLDRPGREIHAPPPVKPCRVAFANRFEPKGRASGKRAQFRQKDERTFRQ